MSGGCSARRTAVLIETPAAPYAAAAGLMGGMDASEPGGDWRPGDSVLLGMTVRNGSEPARELYLRVTVADQLRVSSGNETFLLGDSAEFKMSPKNGEPEYRVLARFSLVMLLVEMFDQHGALVSRTTAMMPEPCLRYGLTEFIELDRVSDPFAARPRGPVVNGAYEASPEQVRSMAGWLALIRLPEFMQREKSVNGIVRTVVREPGLGSIIRHLGVSVSLGLDPATAEPIAPAPPWSGPTYRVPLEVQANDAKATDCTLTVTRADPPLGPCNGLVALEASRPGDPSRRLSVTLLAAKRGAPEQTGTARGP